jgi:hypothetical protein
MLSFQSAITKHATISLFLALTILALLFPNMVHQLYSHILGRFVIVIVISYLAMQHMLLGVFAAFVFVSIIQQNVYHEGFTAGAESKDANPDKKEQEQEKDMAGAIDSQKLSELQEKLDEVSAVQEPNDLLSSDPTRKSDNSKKIQVDPSSKGSSEDVNASEPEAFTLYYSKY